MNPIRDKIPAITPNIAVKNGTGVPIVPGFGSYIVTSRKPPSAISPMSSSITIGMVIKGRSTVAIVGFFFGFAITEN